MIRKYIVQDLENFEFLFPHPEEVVGFTPFLNQPAILKNSNQPLKPVKTCANALQFSRSGLPSSRVCRFGGRRQQNPLEDPHRYKGKEKKMIAYIVLFLI